MPFRNDLSIWSERCNDKAWVFGLVMALALSFHGIGYSQAQNTVGYSGWGIDEYELFDLTPSEIKSKFGQWASLSSNEQTLTINNSITATTKCFFLRYMDGRVCSVKRQFSAPYAEILHIGPELQSKEAALEYKIKSISSWKTIDQESTRQLSEAKKMLADLRRSELKGTTHTSIHHSTE